MSSTEAITMALVVKALDAGTLRQQAIAGNIANANSINYRPLQVNFEQQLSFARQALARGANSVTEADLASVRAFLEPAPAPIAGEAAVMIDQEMVKLAQNTVQYQALLKGLNHHVSILSTAINEGRR
jgi:flagellar basal-body rod protein FlgB